MCAEVNDTHRELLCWYNVSLCAIEQEQWQVARDAAGRVLAADPASESRWIAAAELNSGLIAEGTGDIAAGRIHYTTSRDRRIRNRQHALIIDSLAGLLRVAVAGRDRKMTRQLRARITRQISQRGLVGVEHVGRLFVTLIEASLALHDETAACEYARQGTAFLTERADGLTDPVNRESYLTNVQAHRRVFELVAELA